jgi:hypothetical protein
MAAGRMLGSRREEFDVHRASGTSPPTSPPHRRVREAGEAASNSGRPWTISADDWFDDVDACDCSRLIEGTPTGSRSCRRRATALRWRPATSSRRRRIVVLADGTVGHLHLARARPAQSRGVSLGAVVDEAILAELSRPRS